MYIYVHIIRSSISKFMSNWIRVQQHYNSTAGRGYGQRLSQRKEEVEVESILFEQYSTPGREISEKCCGQVLSIMTPKRKTL